MAKSFGFFYTLLVEFYLLIQQYGDLISKEMPYVQSELSKKIEIRGHWAIFSSENLRWLQLYVKFCNIDEGISILSLLIVNCQKPTRIACSEYSEHLENKPS